MPVYKRYAILDGPPVEEVTVGATVQFLVAVCNCDVTHSVSVEETSPLKDGVFFSGRLGDLGTVEGFYHPGREHLKGTYDLNET